MTVNSDPGQCSATVPGTGVSSRAMAYDNCSEVDWSGSDTGRDLLNGVFHVGTSNVTFVAKDACGNENSCEMKVYVIDNESPAITCPADITIGNDPGSCGAVVSFNPASATDNCISTSVTQISGTPSGSNIGLGETSIIYQAIDANGNVASCEVVVTVVDSEAPEIICPADITLSVAPRWCFANLIYNINATDNCTGALVPTLTSGPVSGTTLPIGSTRVEYSVSDAAGNSSSCGFEVDVLDTNAPEVMTCPGSMTVQPTTSTTPCGSNVMWNIPTAFEACGNLSSSASHSAGGFFYSDSTTSIEYVFDDGYGNQSTCQFSIHVEACAGSPLPVELVSFSARVVEEKVLCNWETSMEINNDRFEVERTRAIGDPEYVGTVLSKGSGNMLQTYDLTDYKPYYGNSFYRLVQFDNDGLRTDYPWQAVHLEYDKFDMELSAYPVPSRNDVMIKVRGVESTAIFTLYDMHGKLLMTERVEGGPEMQHRVDLSKYAEGIYNLEVISEGYRPRSIRLIKSN